MRQLILVEGLPGCGKTTISRKIYEYISTIRETNLYQEGDGHPADLAWCACIPVEQLDSIIKEYPQYGIQLKKFMYIEDGYAVVPYTQFPIDDESFLQLMESYEVYDNRVGFKTFSVLHLKKWKKFSQQTLEGREMAVFECAFLQNHINELLLFHCMSEELIEEYLLNLITTVNELEPILIYLNQPSVYETIGKVSDIRVNKEGKQVWMERVISYIQESPFGIAHSLSGFEGMVSYFEYRKNVELNIIKKLPIDCYIIDNPNYDWIKTWKEIQQILDLHITSKLD